MRDTYSTHIVKSALLQFLVTNNTKGHERARENMGEHERTWESTREHGRARESMEEHGRTREKTKDTRGIMVVASCKSVTLGTNLRSSFLTTINA